jgi:hypothetical protein
MKKLICLLCLTYVSVSFASLQIANVLIVKGKVTYLAPGAKKAKLLTKKSKLVKDTSIYVDGKGFTKIKYINSSFLTVGPNSKVILDMDLKDKTSLVNLVSGKIRALVDKNKNNDKKFLVKTNSATMGVRGTEFQVSFAPKAKKTSLLTYEGRVDMKKSKKNVTQTIKEMKTNLETNQTSVVKGDLFRVSETDIKKADKVKINPKQFLLMKKDNSLGAKKVIIAKSEMSKINAEAKELEKEFKADSNNADTKGLGFVDFDKGVYVPPVNGTMLLGTADSNGEYVPPKGVIVDESKGLVIQENASSKLKDIVKKVNKSNVVPVTSPENAYDRYFDV